MLLAWLTATIAIALLAPPADMSVGESADLVPADSPSRVAQEELSRHFGGKAALSDAVVVFERADGPLTANDRKAIEDLGKQIGRARAGENVDEELRNISILTPESLAFFGTSLLVSDDQRAALISIRLPYNLITKQAGRVVKHAQETVAGYPLPAGLTAAVTGSAGFGYDYAIATEHSHQKTTIVTLAAVILILLVIYRAPLAAMIPLAAISMAAIIMLNMLTVEERFGLHNGMAERIFTFVLLYGAGIDYSVLFISRYREFLETGHSPAESIVLAFNTSFVAITSSTLMTLCGLVMLCFGRFSVFRNSGPAVMGAMIVASAAAVTLVPALLAIVGPAAFWPRKKPPLRSEAVDADPYANRRRFWPAVARFVVTHPWLVLGVTLTALIVPAIRGTSVEWNYDALFGLKPNYPARRGAEMVGRHWPVGQTAPVILLVSTDQPQPADAWMLAANAVGRSVRELPDVGDVRSLATPLGLHFKDWQNNTARMVAADKVNAEYLGTDHRAMRISVVLKRSPLTREAMEDATHVVAVTRNALAATPLRARVQLAGTTAEIIDVRAITQRDFRRISALALVAIFLMVVAVLRDAPLSVFILAATVLSYLTTVGLTYWIFSLIGSHGLEWKVQMLLFIVLVAVGQDYSIFFSLRFAQEARALPYKMAAERAVVFTGPVISSCGIIMAATLGSVMAGDVTSLIQLGFAFALGMLIDTFVVRPLLLPAFIVVARRTLKRAVASIG